MGVCCLLRVGDLGGGNLVVQLPNVYDGVPEELSWHPASASTHHTPLSRGARPPRAAHHSPNARVASAISDASAATMLSHARSIVPPTIAIATTVAQVSSSNTLSAMPSSNLRPSVPVRGGVPRGRGLPARLARALRAALRTHRVLVRRQLAAPRRAWAVVPRRTVVVGAAAVRKPVVVVGRGDARRRGRKVVAVREPVVGGVGVFGGHGGDAVWRWQVCSHKYAGGRGGWR